MGGAGKSLIMLFSASACPEGSAVVHPLFGIPHECSLIILPKGTMKMSLCPLGAPKVIPVSWPSGLDSVILMSSFQFRIFYDSMTTETDYGEEWLRRNATSREGNVRNGVVTILQGLEKNTAADSRTEGCVFQDDFSTSSTSSHFTPTANVEDR